MPIEFKCDSCGMRIKAPDNLAGKKARCPKCQTTLSVPQAGAPPAAQPMPAAPAPPPAAPPPVPSFNFNEPDPEQDPEARRPCPTCGEQILVAAIKCRFCGEVFDPVLREASNPRLKADFNRQITGVGCLWTFFGIMIVLVILLGGAALKEAMGDEDDVPVTVMMLIFGLIAASWLLAGVGSLMKQVWAVWIGLVLSYLAVLGNILTIVTEGARGATQVCIGMGLVVIGIYQAHKVLGIAKRMK